MRQQPRRVTLERTVLAADAKKVAVVVSVRDVIVLELIEPQYAVPSPTVRRVRHGP